MQFRAWTWAAVAGLFFCTCRHAPAQSGIPIPEDARVTDAYGDVIELDQGWTDDTQQAFYNTPQGSEILPYAWILVLEQNDSEKPFLDPANIESFRYIPRKKTATAAASIRRMGRGVFTR